MLDAGPLLSHKNLPMQPSRSELASKLLDPSFVRELEVLRRRLEVRARSGASGEHAARRRGGSAEFQEHRPYSAGDDLRRIDWAAYARTDEPVLKLFRAEEDVIVRIVIDASASLDFGTPPKFDAATRLAAAFGYMALASSERAQVVAAGEGIVREETPVRGRNGLLGLLRALSTITPKGGTDLGRAIDTIVRKSKRPGMLLVVSDFFDSGPLLTALGRAVAAGPVCVARSHRRYQVGALAVARGGDVAFRLGICGGKSRRRAEFLLWPFAGSAQFNLADLGRYPAFDRTFGGLGPFHAIERDSAGRALLGERPAAVARGIEADARRLIAGFQHHGEPPRCNVTELLDLSELLAPVAGGESRGPHGFRQASGAGRAPARIRARSAIADRRRLPSTAALQIRRPARGRNRC